MSRKKVVVAVAAGVVLLGNGAAAYAHWSSTGRAQAAGKAGSVVTLTASAAPSGNQLLYPGVRRDLRVTVENTNSFAVVVSQVRRGATAAVPDAVHAAAGCVDTGVTITGAAYPVSWRVEPKTTGNFALAGALSMAAGSDSACQGATFALPIIVTGVARSD